MTVQHKLFAPLFIVAAFFFLFIVSPAKADIVNICDDAALWPPFAYAPLVNGEPDQSQIQGATVDLLAVIFDEIGLSIASPCCHGSAACMKLSILQITAILK